MREVIVNAFSTPNPNLFFTKSSSCLKALSVSFLLPPFRSLITAFSLPPIPIPTLPPTPTPSSSSFKLRSTSKKPKKLPRTKSKLSPEILLSNDGLGYVLRYFPHQFKYRGRSHEMENAVINDITDLKGIYDYAWSHGIISTQILNEIKRHCNFSEKRRTSDCEVNVNKILESYSDIDAFNIYSPVCLKDYEGPNSTTPIFAPQILWNTLPSSGYDYCPDDHVRKYFNKKNVQRTIHANITNLPYPFTVCSGIIEKWNDSPATVLPLIQKLLSLGLRIWIYSGDADGRVPILSTKYSLEELKLNVTKEWRAWFEGVEVGGWVEEYEGGLTFASIRGVGHQVPVSAPQLALSLFSHFLSSQPLPSSRF